MTMYGAPDTHALAQQLAVLAQKLAREVGAEILRKRRIGVDVAATKSSINDVVTEADGAAERMLADALAQARPEDGLLGEEGASRPSHSGITWVVDPIDGTVNYLYGLPLYAVSVAATVQDATAFADGRRAIAGAIYVPELDELYDAWQGGGARCNGAQISVAKDGPLETALIGTGFGYTRERRAEQVRALTDLLPDIRDIRRTGSAAYDLCLVASGRLNALYERGLQPWDYAAGALIVSEAGGVLLGRAGSVGDADSVASPATPPGVPLLVAGPPGLAAELRKRVDIWPATT
jgi:myo-inositol-1(or 4)-monophosphatase